MIKSGAFESTAVVDNCITQQNPHEGTYPNEEKYVKDLLTLHVKLSECYRKNCKATRFLISSKNIHVFVNKIIFFLAVEMTTNRGDLPEYINDAT